MDSRDNQQYQRKITSNNRKLVTDIYQSVETLSLLEKAALAQHLLNTNALSVVVRNRADVNAAIEDMDRVQLGNTLESIADQVRRLA